MNDFYNVIAYNTLGEVQEVEATGDNWEAVEICLAMSEQFGYAEALDTMDTHCGEYGERPLSLGERKYF